jgi:hypothetical protein
MTGFCFIKIESVLAAVTPAELNRVLTVYLPSIRSTFDPVPNPK